MNSSLTTSNDFIINHNGKKIEFVVGYNVDLKDIKFTNDVVYVIYPELKNDTDDATKETIYGVEICRLPFRISNEEMEYSEFANYMKNKTKKMIKTINQITCN